MYRVPIVTSFVMLDGLTVKKKIQKQFELSLKQGIIKTFRGVLIYRAAGVLMHEMVVTGNSGHHFVYHMFWRLKIGKSLQIGKQLVSYCNYDHN